jgi:aminocarboxymuconate-semialdehyde decarboxylase
MMDHAKTCPCPTPSRRRVLEGALAAAVGLSVVGAASAQPATGTGGANTGVLPGRSAPRTLEGTSSSTPPSAKRGIDIHAHWYPDAYLKLLGGEGKEFGGEYRETDEGFYLGGGGWSGGPLPTKIRDIKLRLAEMDKQGVETHALSLTQPMLYFGTAAFASKLARAFNDSAADVHRQYPDRFVGLMALPLTHLDAAMAEFDRAAKLPGIRGVYMGTNVNGSDYSDPKYLPLFKRIADSGLPLFLHANTTIGSDRLEKFYLTNLLGNPFDSAVAGAHLIFGGVLDKFPTLQVSLPYAGGALPVLIGRLDQGYAVRRDVPDLPQPPSAYLRRFTYDTVGHSAEVMKFLIHMVGPDRLMLGSDYCFDMGYQRPVQDLDVLGLSPADRDMILYGTAAKTLKI